MYTFLKKEMCNIVIFHSNQQELPSKQRFAHKEKEF